jgi:arylsulfatase A-like enzyme
MKRKKIIKRSIIGILLLLLTILILRFFLAENSINKLYGPYPDIAELTEFNVSNPQAVKPNVIIIFVDDLGYADLSCYGSNAIQTPNIDSIAAQGVKFTNYYSAASVCAPSRAGLLTGRYPFRTGIIGNPYPANEETGKKIARKVGGALIGLGSFDIKEKYVAEGLNKKEITIAEALKSVGYRTGMIGKWHLGDFSSNEEFNPINHGFDFYFGVPHSNDLLPCPLYRNTKKIKESMEGEALQSQFSSMYSEEAIRFIEEADNAPFFLYLAETFPHQPLYASGKFKGKSAGGIYGDVVEELDYNVGRILESLKEKGLDKNTLVIFTSDNGPWYEGDTGGYKGRKGESFNGGYKVPFIARYPGVIPERQVNHAVIQSLDLFPTILNLAGVELPEDRTIDGIDIMENLSCESFETKHDAIYFYHYTELQGVLSGGYKYLESIDRYVWPLPLHRASILKIFKAESHLGKIYPLLYNTNIDPNEAYNLMETNPVIAQNLSDKLEKWKEKALKNPRGFNIFNED